MELDYEADLHIDESALDVEWVGQANLFMRYAHALAEAERTVRQKEQRIKIVRSELVLEAHQEGEKALGEGIKTSAPTVEAYYRTQRDHIKAKNELDTAIFEADILRNAVIAFNFHRRLALENLVQLQNQQYFAGPRVPRDLQREVAVWETGNAARREIATEKMKRTSKRSRRTK